MAAFADVGAFCSEPGCGCQDFLPYECAACKRTFCQSHFKQEQHTCCAPSGPDSQGEVSTASAPQAKTLLCAALGCREALSAHNKVNCWRCRKDVCIRHRFEDDHQCVPVDVAVKDALRRARDEMSAIEFAEAQKTLVKVFGNVLAAPGNEKFRTIKKTNAVVQEKLRHPACTEALRLSGFEDTGDAFVCRSNADLALMRRMHSSLQSAHQNQTPAATSASAPTPNSVGGTRLVNGVIVREPFSQPTVVKASSNVATASEASTTSAPVPVPKKAAGNSGGSKPKSAFDFSSRRKQEEAAQAQESQLSEARRLQKERYKAGGTTGGAQEAAPQSPPAAASSASTQDDQQNCAIQ